MLWAQFVIFFALKRIMIDFDFTLFYNILMLSCFDPIKITKRKAQSKYDNKI